jgi:protein TonB
MADRAAFIRLATALILSAFLHLMLIFSPAIHPLRFDRSEKGTQIVLQTRIQPPPKPNTLQAAKAPRRTHKPADRARADASAKRARSAPVNPPQGTASVELKTPGPDSAEGRPDQQSASTETQPEAPKEELSREEPDEASAGPEQREVISVQDPDVPVYPAEAVERGLESCVLAAVYVAASGEVQEVRILHAEIPQIFDGSVIDAHRNARYLPARQDGRNLPSRVLAVVGFVLEPERIRNCAAKYATVARKINALPVSAELEPAFVEEALRAAQ